MLVGQQAKRHRASSQAGTHGLGEAVPDVLRSVRQEAHSHKMSYFGGGFVATDDAFSGCAWPEKKKAAPVGEAFFDQIGLMRFSALTYPVAWGFASGVSPKDGQPDLTNEQGNIAPIMTNRDDLLCMIHRRPPSYGPNLATDCVYSIQPNAKFIEWAGAG